jgi:hypothetical protein
LFRLDMEERQFSKAREELIKRDGQAHEAILQMLRKFDGKKSAALPALPVIIEPVREIPGEAMLEEEKIVPRPRRRENMSLAGGELRRNRRMGKFVEELPIAVQDEILSPMAVDVAEENKAEHGLSELGPKVISYEPAPWEEGSVKQGQVHGDSENVRRGPKVVSYEPAPWEESTDKGSSHRSSDDVARGNEAGLRLGPRVVSYKQAPWEDESMEESSHIVMEEEVDENRADWRLGPKVTAYEPAPWEESRSMERTPSQTPLEDILEADEEVGSPASQYTIPGSIKNRILTPPTEYTSASPGGYFPIYKFPTDAFPPPSTPRSVSSPSPPVSELTIPKTPPKSPTNIRTRAGLKKIFLSTLRSKKRDENEPLSPSPTISSTASTPSIPTPTIRITSPFHPRRIDGSSIYGDDMSLRTTSPISSPVERLEPGYRLPELRLSRADWSEWGRQVADRL